MLIQYGTVLVVTSYKLIIMKKLFFLFLVFTTTMIHAQEQGTLRVVGNAEIEVLPDLMQFNLNFNLNSDTQKESIEELNALIDDVIAALTKAGIETDSIKTDNFRTSVVDNTYRNGKNYFTSQQNMYFIMQAEPDAIIAILNVLNDIDESFNFSPSPMISTALRKQKEVDLSKAAFADAKMQADLLGQSGAFKLGKIKSVDFQSNRPPIGFLNDVQFEEEAVISLRGQSSLNFGNYNLAPQKLKKSVTVTYFIEQ